MNPPSTVLIADDHPIFRKGLCEVIEGDPSLVVTGQAANGEEALRWVEELRLAVVILDINMPKLSGLQVARVLAGRETDVKLVLLTMHESEDLNSGSEVRQSCRRAVAVAAQSSPNPPPPPCSPPWSWALSRSHDVGTRPDRCGARRGRSWSRSALAPGTTAAPWCRHVCRRRFRPGRLPWRGGPRLS
ncbi:MAG: response regulator transcription factor [Verrucomicrobiota bacterium]